MMSHGMHRQIHRTMVVTLYDNMSIEDHRNLRGRNAEEIARDGGRKGATIVRKGRSGEQAIQEWEKKNGNINIPAYQRRGTKRKTGYERFSTN